MKRTSFDESKAINKLPSGTQETAKRMRTSRPTGSFKNDSRHRARDARERKRIRTTETTADTFTGFDSEQLTLSFLVTHDTPGHTAAHASPDQMVADGGADATPAVMHRENQGVAQRINTATAIPE